MDFKKYTYFLRRIILSCISCKFTCCDIQDEVYAVLYNYLVAFFGTYEFCSILIILACLSTVCQKNEHQVPLTIYASSESPIHATSFSIVDMYSVLDIAYYNSEDKLMDKTEYSETVCVLESEQMAYRLIVNVYDLNVYIK